jgi:hypothetical protein
MDPLIGHIITALLSFISGLALQRLADKPRLEYFVPGNFLFELKDPEITLRTDSLTIQNRGRKSASNIEIVHKVKPDHFQFSQAISYSEDFNPDGEHLIKIDNLGPREFINIQYLSHTQAPFLRTVRSDQGPAKLIQVQFQVIYSKWVQAVAGVLMVSGAGFLIYWVFKGLCFLYQFAVGL